MNKPLKLSGSRLVYVHGTNGSGKSTLARAVMAAAKGPSGVHALPDNRKATWTHTKAGVVLVGKYGTACGGVDGLNPYASIHDIVSLHAPAEARLFAEGLVTPGLDTCRRLADLVDDHLFVFLDTPLDQCVANVLKRRHRKGTVTPYDAAHLHKKHRSALSWADRLAAAGLRVEVHTWVPAYARCLQMLSLPQPHPDHLL